MLWQKSKPQTEKSFYPKKRLNFKNKEGKQNESEEDCICFFLNDIFFSNQEIRKLDTVLLMHVVGT